MDSLQPPPSPNGAPPRVLIWLQDPVEADLLAIQLRQAGLVVVAARSGEHVRNALAWAPADAFIVEIPALRAADTLTFIKAQRSKNTALYAVAPTGGLDRATELKLLSIGCRQLWSTPLSAVAIAQQIWSAPAGATPLAKDSAELRGVSGDFRYQPLTYVIHAIRRHRISARLHARLAAGEGDDWGVVLVHNGEVIDAETPGLRGKAAAIDWLGRAEHQFVLHPLPDTAPDLQRPDVIQEDIARLLMRAQHRSDLQPSALGGARPSPAATGSGARPPTHETAGGALADGAGESRQQTRTPRETTAPRGATPIATRGADAKGGDLKPLEPPRQADRMGPATARQARPSTESARSEATEATLIPADLSAKRGKARVSTADGVPRAPSGTQVASPSLHDAGSVAHVKRVRRVDAVSEQSEETEHSGPAAFRVGPRRSTSPRGNVRSTRGGLFVATAQRAEGDGTSPGRGRIGTRRGRIAMLAHDDEGRGKATETEAAETAPAESAPSARQGRQGAPAAMSFFDHPRLDGVPSGVATKIQKDDPTDPPKEAVRADPAGFYVNPKSGLIHLSSLNRPADPGPSPQSQPSSAGLPRVNLHHSQLLPTRRRHPTNAGLRAEEKAVFEDKLAGVGTEDGFEPPGLGRRFGWVAGWIAFAATLVILAIVSLTAGDSPGGPAREDDGTGSPTEVIASLHPRFLSNTLKAPDLKVLATAMIQVDSAPSEVRPVLDAAARLSPKDADIAIWRAVLARADGDLAAFEALRARAELLAPKSTEVQRLHALSP